MQRDPHFGDTFRTWRRAVGATLVCALCWGAFGCGRTRLDPGVVPATGGGSSAGGVDRVSTGGAVVVGGRGTVGGAGTATVMQAAGMPQLAAAGEGTAAVDAAAGVGGGGAAAGGAGGEGGAPCGADECPPWVQVGGDLPPAYSYAIAAAPDDVGAVYTGNDSYGSVYKTTTSGASWFPASSGLPNDGVRALAVDPFDSKYVWTGSLSGVYQSSNAGESWTKVDVGSGFPWVQWITVDPVVKGRVYVLLNSNNKLSANWSVAYASDDRGLTWRQLGTPANFRANTLDVDTSDPTLLFLGTYGQGVLESHDAGATFQSFAGPPGKVTYQVIYEPTSKTLCAIAGDGMASSQDGGATWQAQPTDQAFLITLAPGPTFYVDGNAGVFRSTDCSNWTHVDQRRGYHAVVDGAGAVYTATVEGGFQGVRRSPDGVSPFVNVNHGITTADVCDLALDASVTDGLFVDVRYYGLSRSIDGAAAFSSAIGDLGGVGTTVFPDALLSTGSTLFAFTRTYGGRLYRSDDHGSTWSKTLLTLPNNGYASAVSVLPSPEFASDNIVYLGIRTVQGAAVSFEQSLDGGVTFTPRGNGDFATQRMTWDKTHDGWLWALGAHTVANVSSQKLYLSKDTGLTWSEVTLPVQGTYYGGLEAAVTPSGEVLYVPVGGEGLLRSDDAGATWQLVGAPPGDLLSTFAVDPTDAQTLYLVTVPNDPLPSSAEHGLFKSRDGGVTWLHADRGLAPGAITALLIEPNNPRILYAGVSHAGLYKTTTGGE